MSWNNRVIVENISTDQYIEFKASVVEVHYIDDQAGHTESQTASGFGNTPYEAIQDLRTSLMLQLESVQHVLRGDTVIYCPGDKSTYNPGARTEVFNGTFILDKDDSYLEEKYGDEE